jgi:hypothetical protein
MQSRSPEIVIHRQNTVAQLKALPRELGVEIDLRADGSEIVLNHDPFKGGERFINWLEAFRHGLLVINIKEAGIETEAIRLLEAFGVKRFFLLDVEFPYIYRASRAGEQRIALRYSEDEAIETVVRYRSRIDWVWIDTNTRLPLDANTVEKLYGFSTCLVCPERWGRPSDIPAYRQTMKALGFSPDAVMTSLAHAPAWRSA